MKHDDLEIGMRIRAVRDDTARMGRPCYKEGDEFDVFERHGMFAIQCREPDHHYLTSDGQLRDLEPVTK